MCGWVIWRDGEPFRNTRNRISEETRFLIKQISHRGSQEPIITKSTNTYYDHWDFAHVRLPIQGNVYQPLTDPTGHMLVYTGELFNYDTENYDSDAQWLFDQLANRSNSNVSEFLSSEILQRLDGFYSFAFMDHGEIHIATDYLAQKPTYIRYDEDGRVKGASSEMRGLLLEEDLEKWKEHLDEFWVSTVQKFRYYPNTDGRTWHTNIKVLPPGKRLRVSATGHATMHDFGRVVPAYEAVAKCNQDDPNHLAMVLRKLVWKAVKERIQLSDVPVSVLLSGGLDSSIIYKIAETEGLDITTFTIDNEEDQKFVSLLKPKKLKFLNCGHRLTMRSFLRANEGPVDLGSMIAQNLIGKAIKKEKFLVALSGDGADELFGGYRRINEYDSQKSDVWSELVNYHLPRLDKMMMQSTIELRSPYLARDVVEFALALPYKWRKNKNLLKMAFETDLPKEIIDRPKEPLKLESVRIDKTKHSQDMMEQWLKLKSPV